MTLQELVNRIWIRAYLDSKEQHAELIKDYARECVKASLEKAAEGFTRVTHDKIANESNIVLL